MSIDQSTCDAITSRTVRMWREKAAHDDEFLRLTKGKERGHRMADYVDECTTSLLKVHFVTRFQIGKGGKPRVRSMGDVWLKSEGIFNPINVKSGLVGANGQPNLVSLKKVLRALLHDQIDSYYLLFVKFETGKVVRPHVLLADLLEHLEWVTYDDGPGQMMLLEQKFFEAKVGGHVPKTGPVLPKIERLFDLLKDGNQRLIQNRKRTIAGFEREIVAYKAQSKHTIDQSGIGIMNESDQD